MIRRSAALVLVALTIVACGKKGPPLEPLRLVPNQPADMTGRRIGTDVQLRFTLPTQNATGTQQIDLAHVEIYAVTVAPGAIIPPNRELMTRKYLIKTVPVQPLPEEGAPEPEKPKAPAGKPVEQTAKPVPPPVKDERPLPGEKVVVVEQLTATELTPAIVPKRLTGKEAAAAAAAASIDPAVPIRVYVARGFSRHGHAGPPSIRATLPLVDPPPPPSDVKATVSETSLDLEWSAPEPRVDPVASARLLRALELADAAAALAPTPAAKRAAAPPPVPADAPLAIPTAPLRLLPGIAFPIAPPQAFSFNVYLFAEGKVADEPLNTTLLTVPQFGISAVPWDTEQCYVVRAVRVYENVRVESEHGAPQCVTPHDTFAPAAPSGLRGAAAPGVISLSWDANKEADLAGYLVLRGEAPGDTLQALTPAPIRETTYRDTTVKPGVRYVYAIVAVDAAKPPNTSPQSARYEEIAR